MKYTPASVIVKSEEELELLREFIHKHHGRCDKTHKYYGWWLGFPDEITERDYFVIHLGNAKFGDTFYEDPKEIVAIGWDPHNYVTNETLPAEQFLKINDSCLEDNNAAIVRSTDYFTHHNDWVTACTMMKHNSTEGCDILYWEHQLEVLAKLKVKYGQD